MTAAELREIADYLEKKEVPEHDRKVIYLGTDGHLHMVREGEIAPCPPKEFIASLPED